MRLSDLNSKPQAPSDLRDLSLSIYRYENVVNVNVTPGNTSGRSLSDILLQFLPENQYHYQVEHTNKNKSRKIGLFIDLIIF